jgi:beta-N-acetylhexosaminidase
LSVPRPFLVRPGRRLTVPLALGVLAVVLAAVLGLSSSGSSHGFQLGGVAPTVLSTPSASGPARGATEPAHTPFRPDPAAQRLAAAMTLPGAVAQVFAVALADPSPASVAALGGLPWGGLVFGASSYQTDAQIKALVIAAAASVTRAGPVAPLLAVPQEGGRASAIHDLPPQSEPAIGADGNAALARSQAVLAGRSLRAFGFNMTLAPLADVDTDGGPLGNRLYGTDPATVSTLADAAVRGYSSVGLVSAPGHFPGEGAASADPDQMTATVGGALATLEARDLVPFAAVARHAPVIMMSNAVYAALDGVTPASLLRSAVSLLRQNYGYRGVVMSGDLDAALQATGGDAGADAIAALYAGDDLLYISGTPSEQLGAYHAVLAAAQRTAALRARVYAAVARDLTLKVHFGIAR